MAKSEIDTEEQGRGTGHLAEQPPIRSSRPTDDGELLDAEAACKLLGVHRNTLYRLIRTDDMPALRFTRGGRWRFRRRDLLDWIEGRQARRVS